MADNNTNMDASAVEEKQQHQIESARMESPTAATVSSSDVGDAVAASAEIPEPTVREEPGKGNPARLTADGPPEIGGFSSSAPVSGGATAVTPTVGRSEAEGGPTSSAAAPLGAQVALEGGLPEATCNSGGKQSAKKEWEDACGSMSDTLLKRARGELGVTRSKPACAICGKQFATWKGVSSHLKAHPDPNTTERTPVLEEQLAPMLLSIAWRTLEMMRKDADVASYYSAAVPSLIHHNIDLNVVPEASSSSSSSSPPEIKEEKGFDLNLPPPENEDGSDESTQNM